MSMKYCIVSATCSFRSILSGPCSFGKHILSIYRVPGSVPAAGPHNFISNNHNSFLLSDLLP